MTVCFLVILISSVIGFFLTLSSTFISTACLIISFLSVLGIRIGLGKMDEFKSLYVNTVPMINPEKDFKEGRSLAENEELMLSKGVSADEVEAALEALVEEGQQLTQIEEIVVINESSQIEDVEVTELEEIQDSLFEGCLSLSNIAIYDNQNSSSGNLSKTYDFGLTIIYSLE